MSSALARRFQFLVDQFAKGNKKAFAELTGKSASHVYKICRGSSRPSLAYLEHLNEAFRIDLNWLLTGEQSQQDAMATGSFNANQETVNAPVYDVQASAGMGTDVASEEVSEYFTFNKRWLTRELGVSGDKLAFVSVNGDSMEPTLKHGDQVLVDMSKAHIDGRSVYLIKTDQGLMVKRLASKQPSEIQIHSDNPDYDTVTLTLSSDDQDASAFAILGKVVWSARTL